jgi:TonB family protein
MPEIPLSGSKVAGSARTAEASVLEIEVTIQGSKCVEGKDQRELFTETTKTTLVFGNGAVVNLKAKVLAGQCLFLRNDQSGREILCKVLESRPAGQANYTDLEFTAHDPNFWDVKAEKAPAVVVAEKTDAQQKIDAAVASLTAVPAAESNQPAPNEEIPETSSEASMTALADLLPAAKEALPDSEDEPESSETPRKSEGAGTSGANDTSGTSDANDTEDAEHLAALFAMDDKSRAKRESDTTRNKEEAADPVSEEASHQDVATPHTEGGTTSISALELRLRTLPYIHVLKNPIAIGIAASVLIAVTLGAAWHAKRSHSIHGKNPASAAFFPSKQLAQPPAAQSSQMPGAVAATPAQAAQKTQQAVAAQGPDGKVALNSSARPTSLGDGPDAKGIEESPAPSVISVHASIPGSDRAVLAKPKHRKASDPSREETIPAKIVSQPQPGIPEWAKGLDTDGVVRLDALIDEKGNVKETRALSGPRALQREAERVVALWMFEPAMADGKPTATHMVLTVQFQM